MPDDTAKRFLFIVRLKGDSDRGRIEQVIPDVQSMLQRRSTTPPTLAFAATDGLLFGVFIKTNQPLPSILVQFEKLETTLNGDTFLCIELGEDKINSGFGTAAAWLDRN